jgi:hypothetical protein
MQSKATSVKMKGRDPRARVPLPPSLLAAAAAALLAFAASACTGGGGEGGSTASSDGPYNCFKDAPADAPVTIDVFTSPTRAATDENPADKVRTAAEGFAGKVKCSLKPVSPFEQADALAAGKAILAAEKQGKAWDMYTQLTRNVDKLAEGYYLEAAREIGLDTAQFETDFASDDLAAQVKSNTQKTSQGHPLRRVQLDGEWAPCGTPALDCLGAKIQEKLQAGG